MALHRRFSRKKKAGIEVWCGESFDKLPNVKVAPLVPDIFASYSGPERGLALIADLESAKSDEGNANCRRHNKKAEVAGARTWSMKSRKAYGICMSLYDQHPINGKISGDPIADCFAIMARKNNALMIVADGVNWGEKSKMAARCAVYGCMRDMNEKLFCAGKPIKNTHEAFTLLLKSLEVAHQKILEHQGGLTTLCVGLVCPVKDSKQFVVSIVNVGDSLGYVFSKSHGVREITTGSHDIQSERDIRDAGGALGPVNGNEPELHNLTCSLTFLDPGDIVYLTTDGISDNFDPVVTKIAMPKRRSQSESDVKEESDAKEESDTKEESDAKEEEEDSSMSCSEDGRPELEPHERHQYAVKEMERIIHEFELFTENSISAQELSGALLQHVLRLTDSKRKVLENPDLYGKRLKAKDRKRRDSEIVAKMSKAPGKLDHASIVAYEVGHYHGNDDEDYEIESEEELDNTVSNDLSNDQTNGETSSSNQAPLVRRISFESAV